jgi:riboflavin kinase/FMN adenylyltransferase
VKSLYIFSGKVTEGKKRGRNLGFPTANIALKENIPSGIYISWTELDKNHYPSLTFIGEAKTFDEHLFQSETWILDFEKNIYGRECRSNERVNKFRVHNKGRRLLPIREKNKQRYTKRREERRKNKEL